MVIILLIAESYSKKKKYAPAPSWTVQVLLFLYITSRASRDICYIS